jgi:hypothetical protein
MFHTNKPSPYERTPLSSLRLHVYDEVATSTTTTTPEIRPPPTYNRSVVNNGGKPSFVVVKELDEESGYRILDYIYGRGGTVVVSAEEMEAFRRNRLARVKHVSQAQHKPAFYVPPSSGGARGGATQSARSSAINTLLDQLVDQSSLKTMSNVRRITKDILLYNGVTVEALLRHCRVSISTLRAADIVTQFQDLVELGFRPQDLLIDRTLFNCNTLKNLFAGADYRTIVAHGVAFDLTHLMMDGSFLSSELIALGFPLGAMIERGEISQSQLRALKFPFAELVELGLCKAHLAKLGLSREFATQPMRADGRGGFGWTTDEFDSLL